MPPVTPHTQHAESGAFLHLQVRPYVQAGLGPSPTFPPSRSILPAESWTGGPWFSSPGLHVPSSSQTGGGSHLLVAQRPGASRARLGILSSQWYRIGLFLKGPGIHCQKAT